MDVPFHDAQLESTRAQLQKELDLNIEMQKETAVDIVRLRTVVEMAKAQNAKLVSSAAEKDEHVARVCAVYTCTWHKMGALRYVVCYTRWGWRRPVICCMSPFHTRIVNTRMNIKANCVALGFWQLERERLQLEARVTELESTSAAVAAHSDEVNRLKTAIADKDSLISEVCLDMLDRVLGPVS